MSATREKFGIEGVLYVGVIIVAATLTIGFAAFSFISARDARSSASLAQHAVDTLCSNSNLGRTQFNEHYAQVLRDFLTTAAAARQIASENEGPLLARVDAATAAKYRLYAQQAHDLPLLNC